MLKIAEGEERESQNVSASSLGAIRDVSDGHPTRSDRAAAGKAARSGTQLEAHAQFSPTGSRDSVTLLLSQADSRVPELVPIRHGRNAETYADQNEREHAALAAVQSGRAQAQAGL
jgi:hypothetical protein